MKAKEALETTKSNTVYGLPRLIVNEINFNATMGLRTVSFSNRDVRLHLKTLKKLGYSVEVDKFSTNVSW